MLKEGSHKPKAVVPLHEPPLKSQQQTTDLLLVVPEEEEVRAAVAAEGAAVFAAPAVDADELEADGALVQRLLFFRLLAADADRGNHCVGAQYSTRSAGARVS